MCEAAIKESADVYHFVENLKAKAESKGMDEFVARLGNAMRLGSSTLEILGAIRQTIIENRETVGRLLGPEGEIGAEQVIAFVDKAFGR